MTRGALVVSTAGYLATLLLPLTAGWLAVAPAAVFSGQAWRLVTYPVVNAGILSFLCGLLLLWSFGSEMEARWGSRRFVLFLLSATVLAGFVGVLSAWLFPLSFFESGFGLAPPLTALIVAWTLVGPRLPANFFGVFPTTRLGFAAICLALVVFSELEHTRSLSRLLFVLGGLPVAWLFERKGGPRFRVWRLRSPWSRRKFRVVSREDERVH